ncbi:MAG: apolipoprotein N-acyltransferase [Alistipes sp.]|nr:apolipoprotein N-acyltransferase [Alistipes sp.]
MKRDMLLILLSVVLLSVGWLGLSGLGLLVAFVPLLMLSEKAENSRRGWWQTFWRALLSFVLWNVATIWWIWNATPIGPIAATLFSTFYNMVAFMLYHTVVKKAPRALAYTTLVAAWIATEYWYTSGDFSWPWLTLGNGFSHDVWAVQWYEWTGVFGGSLWVLVSNLLVFEAIRHRTPHKIVAALAGIVLPVIVSLGLWFGYEEPSETVRVSAIQPNVDCYEKFDNTDALQVANIFDLLGEVPAGVDFILLPETAMPGHYWEPTLSKQPPYKVHRSHQPMQGGYARLVSKLVPSEQPEHTLWNALRDTLRLHHPEAMVLTGANTNRFYTPGLQTETARRTDGGYYDHFNTAVGVDTTHRVQLHHKGKLVIGVENTPTWVFSLMDFLVVDLGGIVGQIGIGKHGSAFEHRGVKIGPAICYEGVYGEFFGDHVRRGAELMAILTNDGWWGDTPGYEHLFTLSRLRAIEHRRAVVRSANTGRSGFISARGEISSTLGWEERGVLTEEVALNREQTLYTRYGDYLGRVANYLLLLSVLYYMAYRVKRRNYLVD